MLISYTEKKNDCNKERKFKVSETNIQRRQQKIKLIHTFIPLACAECNDSFAALRSFFHSFLLHTDTHSPQKCSVDPTHGQFQESEQKIEFGT
jgi:hypothetical protein